MSFHHHHFTCLLLLFLSFFTPSFSLSFIFNDFKDPNSDNLTVNGVADITSSGILRLTNDTPRLIGHGFYPYPIPFKDPTSKKPLSFSTSFVFAMVPEYKRLGGHGLAFTIFSANGLAGAQPNQYLRLLNDSNNGKESNHLFAIELDTVKDFEFSDINDNHVGININSMVSKNSTKAGFYVDGNSTIQDINLNGGKKIQAKCHSFTVFREAQDIRYVGFSAATGKLASSHYIFGWSFNMSGKAQSFNLNNPPSIPGAKKNHKVFLIGVSVAVLLGLAIIAIAGIVFVM